MKERDRARTARSCDFGRGENPPEAKARWQAPSIEKLPRLTDLTLQTGDPVPGDEGVF